MLQSWVQDVHSCIFFFFAWLWWTVAAEQHRHTAEQLRDSGIRKGFRSPVALFLMGLGVNVLRPHSLIRSLLLCHKINMLDVTPVRVNINTPATGLGVSQGSAACGGGKDRDYSSTLTASPTWHQYVRKSLSWCYVNSVWRINGTDSYRSKWCFWPLVYSEQTLRLKIYGPLLQPVTTHLLRIFWGKGRYRNSNFVEASNRFRM